MTFIYRNAQDGNGSFVRSSVHSFWAQINYYYYYCEFGPATAHTGMGRGSNTVAANGYGLRRRKFLHRNATNDGFECKIEK